MRIVGEMISVSVLLFFSFFPILVFLTEGKLLENTSRQQRKRTIYSGSMVNQFEDSAYGGVKVF